jgi:hypothetical protein
LTASILSDRTKVQEAIARVGIAYFGVRNASAPVSQRLNASWIGAKTLAQLVLMR